MTLIIPPRARGHASTIRFLRWRTSALKRLHEPSHALSADTFCVLWAVVRRVGLWRLAGRGDSKQGQTHESQNATTRQGKKRRHANAHAHAPRRAPTTTRTTLRLTRTRAAPTVYAVAARAESVFTSHQNDLRFSRFTDGWQVWDSEQGAGPHRPYGI